MLLKFYLKWQHYLSLRSFDFVQGESCLSKFNIFGKKNSIKNNRKENK